MTSSAVSDPARLPSLEALKHQGHRGGRILLHRSIWNQRLPATRLWGSVLLALTLSGLMLSVRPWVSLMWSAEVGAWLAALQLPLPTPLPPPEAFDGWVQWQLDLPVLGWRLPAPGPLALLLNVVALVAAWWGSGRFSDAFRPACYLLRLACLIQGAAVLWFWWMPASFPHTVDEHYRSGLQQMWALLMLSPWLHLATYYLFPVTWWHRLALTGMTWVYLLLLAPLQQSLHLAVLHHLGMVFMPLLYLLLGVMVPIVGLVALYGWAMSWANEHPDLSLD